MTCFIICQVGCRYLDVGRDIVASLQNSAKCRCGYCHIADVESHQQDDHMESFFLAETVGLRFIGITSSRLILSCLQMPYAFQTCSSSISCSKIS